MEFVVGIGEIVVSRTENDIIKTYALASCLGVIMYVPRLQTMAMAHMLLPSSANLQKETVARPAQYVDTGIDAMVNLFQHRLGVERKELRVSVFGGAESEICNHYNVSERNIETAKATLKKHGLQADRMETGGPYARTLTGYSRDGHIQVTQVLMGLTYRGNQKSACL